MEETPFFSRTTMFTAYFRAYHAMHDEPKIFDDFLAYHLLTEEGKAFLEPLLVRSLQLYSPERAASCPDHATALMWSMQALPSPTMVLGRARYTEDIFDKTIKQGVKQYVLLGSGMDTFAFRRPELVEQLKVFEVDHPATQASKRERLAELGWKQPAQLHFIPADFKLEHLMEALIRSSYDLQTLSLFSWAGVTYYLTREAVFATLRAIANIAPSGSTVVFDYMDTDAFIPERAAKRVQIMQKNTRRLGEQMITGFDPSTISTDLERLGLHLYEDLSPSDIQKRYFQGRTDGYYACEHVHFAWAVVE